MSNFFFFTDIDSVGNQAATDAFGPVIGSTDTQFRVTSIHRPTQSATPNAYAVCDGLLLVQDAGNSLVNLILKPTEQPPFAFPKIKFFIYRGIEKDTLVSGSEVAASATNDLTKSIWDSQNARNASANSTDHAPAEALGIDISGNGSIDDVFYREGVSYQLPLVRAGWSLGKFAPTQFGFEIMVEAIGFDPELPLARTSVNIITVAALPASPTQAQEFEYWHDKEAILSYIDPCAFFGGFYFHRLRVKYAAGSAANKKKNEIYDDVLKGAHLAAAGDGVYFNRNKTYLDIRNEYNYSINYFKNYGTYSNTDINCAFEAGTSVAARNYYASTWPLMIIDNSDLPGNNASPKNIIRLALPDGNGDNPLPTLYISAGYLEDLYPREPKDKAKLIDLNVSSGFTDEVSLAIPNRDGLSSTTISSYIKLKYFKRIDPSATTAPVSSGTVIRAGSFLDNVFAPFDMKIPFSGPEKIKSVIYDAEVFVDMSLSGGYDFVGSVGILDDGTNYTFILNPKIVRTQIDKKTRVVSLSGEKSSDVADVWTLIASQLPKKVVRKSSLEFTDPANNIDYLEIADEKDDQPSPYEEPYLGYRLITCKKADLTSIDRTSFTTKSPIYLRANNLLRYADKLGQEYWNFEFPLIGYWLNGSTLEVKEVASNIEIYLNGNVSRGDDIQVGHQATTAQTSALQAVAPVPPIKHIFVLMLENRSFDHMLGFSNLSGIDGTIGAPHGATTTINGASAANTNIDDRDLLPKPAKVPADFQVVEADFGPPHEFMDVLRQLCGKNDYIYRQDDGIYLIPQNDGFIYSYAEGEQEIEPDERLHSPNPDKIMNCFDPAQLPVLTTLAREYAVCDNWFSSLPGPTWPNRFFVHAATSGGLPTSPTPAMMSLSILANKLAGYDFENGHIYDRLDARLRLTDWRVYEGDELPQVCSLKGMNLFTLENDYSKPMTAIEFDLLGQSFSPTYIFIEPNYGNLFGGNESQFLSGNSQHPRDDVRPGEMLIKRVYEAIRNSPHWNNSVLVITYDEHGGFYDHVPPPESIAPGDKGDEYPNKFKFGSFGVRVPTVIVSPLIPKGVIDHTLYDHSSILATLERMFNLEPLTERDKNANDFRHLFSLTSPRVTPTDAPQLLVHHPPETFPGAVGDPTYHDIPDVTPPIIIQPGGGTIIDSPTHPRHKKSSEKDLKRLLESDPSLRPPTKLLGVHSPELPGWLHVAFRRRLAVRPEDGLLARNERERVLREYCAVQTVEDAKLFVELARQEVRDFRNGNPPV